jgi:hypothetical protein
MEIHRLIDAGLISDKEVIDQWGHKTQSIKTDDLIAKSYKQTTLTNIPKFFWDEPKNYRKGMMAEYFYIINTPGIHKAIEHAPIDALTNPITTRTGARSNKSNKHIGYFKTPVFEVKYSEKEGKIQFTINSLKILKRLNGIVVFIVPKKPNLLCYWTKVNTLL